MEIKIRAWNQEHGEFVFADINDIVFYKREFSIEFRVGFSHFPTEGWVFQLYTGYKDKTGQDIYVGDILKSEVYSTLDGEVEDLETFFYWISECAIIDTVIDHVRVTDNIYEANVG